MILIGTNGLSVPHTTDRTILTLYKSTTLFVTNGTLWGGLCKPRYILAYIASHVFIVCHHNLDQAVFIDGSNHFAPFLYNF